MDIAVSVCCITYNHKEYIRENLEGILNQKFDYPFEIIVHDDVSTDGTIEILKEYKEKYPDKIKLLLEEENRYQYGEKMFYLAAKEAVGKYIAICEGDDYWCDPYKLKKQFEFMEKNLDCTYLCHASYMRIYGKDNLTEFRTFDDDRYINLEEVLENGCVFPTASLFVRRESFNNIPEFYLKAPVEDEPLKLLCLSQGKGYYSDELMCVYRKNHPGSWNATVKQQKEKRLNHHREKKKMYESFNLFTDKKYESGVKAAILIEDFNILMTNQDYKELKNSKYEKVISKLRLKDRIRLKAASYMPGLYKLMLKLYKH